MTAGRRRWRTVLPILGLACWLAAAAAPAVEIAATERQSLAGHLEIFHDPEGHLDLEAVRQAAGDGKFTVLATGDHRLGYRPGATWIRFALHNGGSAVDRWLDLNSALMERADLHVLRTGGRSHQWTSGAAVPVAARPLASAKLLFPLALGSGETAECYLRLAGKPSLVADLELWQPAAYADAGRRSAALWALAAGSALLASLYSIVAWRSRRQPAMLALAGGQLGLAAVAAILEGLAANLVPAGQAVWQSRLLWAALFAALGCHGAFARAFLPLAGEALWRRRLLAGTTLLAGTLAGAALLWFPPVLWAVLALALVIGLLLAIARPAFGAGPAGRTYGVAWALLCALIVLQIAAALGLVANLPPVIGEPVAGVAAVSVAMAFALHLDLWTGDRGSGLTRRQLASPQENEPFHLKPASDPRNRELAEALARAERASRAKSAFLSVVSHELRTPLHTILGYTQLLQRQSAGDARDKLTIVANSSEQLLRRINDVLDFSRGEAFAVDIALQPLVLADLLREVEDSARIMARRRGNRFEVRLEPGCPAVFEADEPRLLQVLQNLIDNACKYTEDGVVCLTVAPDPSPGATTADGRWLRLRFAVEDTGCGIAADDQPYVFEAFNRAGSRLHQSGVGLGLAIARQFVKAMGGEIQLESIVGQGSRFELMLPVQRSDDVPAHRPATGGEAPTSAGHPLRLLVADDIPENRRLLEEACRRLGFDVLSAADGAEALTVCLEAEPPVAAALVDQFMPGADGWAVLRAVRTAPERATLPVILVSAAAPRRPDDLPAGIEFDDILLKPLRLDQLLPLLKRVLGDAWQTPATPTPPTDAEPLVLPPEEHLASLRKMVALGQVVALQRQAATLAATNPEWAGFCDEVVRRCKAVDLPGLKRLVEGWNGHRRVIHEG